MVILLKQNDVIVSVDNWALIRATFLWMVYSSRWSRRFKGKPSTKNQHEWRSYNRVSSRWTRIWVELHSNHWFLFKARILLQFWCSIPRLSSGKCVMNGWRNVMTDFHVILFILTVKPIMKGQQSTMDPIGLPHLRYGRKCNNIILISMMCDNTRPSTYKIVAEYKGLDERKTCK